MGGITDLTFWLNEDDANTKFLGPLDFHQMQWVYKFHMKDAEFEEDNAVAVCPHLEKDMSGPSMEQGTEDSSVFFENSETRFNNDNIDDDDSLSSYDEEMGSPENMGGIEINNLDEND